MYKVKVNDLWVRDVLLGDETQAKTWGIKPNVEIRSKLVKGRGSGQFYLAHNDMWLHSHSTFVENVENARLWSTKLHGYTPWHYIKQIYVDNLYVGNSDSFEIVQDSPCVKVERRLVEGEGNGRFYLKYGNMWLKDFVQSEYILVKCITDARTWSCPYMDFEPYHYVIIGGGKGVKIGDHWLTEDGSISTDPVAWVTCPVVTSEMERCATGPCYYKWMHWWVIEEHGTGITLDIDDNKATLFAAPPNWPDCVKWHKRWRVGEHVTVTKPEVCDV